MLTTEQSPVSKEIYSDFIQPFLIDHSSIRGRLVRLDESLNQILSAHHYPASVSRHFVEQIVLSALLSATLTGDGILTVHAKGDGAVKFMVVDVMAGGTIRGYAEIDEAALKKIPAKKARDFNALLGKGFLIVTLDQGGSSERYQGIVELNGKTLSEAFKGYFVQSQQAEIEVHVAVQEPDDHDSRWMAGGMIIERVPDLGGKESELTPEEQDELWKRTELFMRTLKPEEMLDSKITPQNLLYRLFNEDGVWVYKLQPLQAGCRCSRERITTVLQSIPKEELVASLDDGRISIHCQFCNKREVFSKSQLDALFRKPRKKKAE